MKIFSAIQTQWSEFYNAVSSYLSKVLGKDGNYGPSNICGQIFTVKFRMERDFGKYEHL